MKRSPCTNANCLIWTILCQALGMYIVYNSWSISPQHHRLCEDRKTGPCRVADSYNPKRDHWDLSLGPEFVMRGLDTYDVADSQGLGPWWLRKNVNRTLVVIPIGDLGSKLQTIAAAITLSRTEDFRVKINFRSNAMDDLDWVDLFEQPLLETDLSHFEDGSGTLNLTDKIVPCIHDNVIIWENISKLWMRKDDDGHEELCIQTCHLVHGDPSQWWSQLQWFYRILKPVYRIREQVLLFREGHNWEKYTWVGVHIDSKNAGLRHLQSVEEPRENYSDHSPSVVVSNEPFVQQMNRMFLTIPNHDLELWQVIKPMRFFLMTENEEARKLVMSSFRPGIVTDAIDLNEDAENPKKFGKTEQSIINLMLTASCRALIGTPFSSLSRAGNLIGDNFYLEPKLSTE